MIHCFILKMAKEKKNYESSVQLQLTPDNSNLRQLQPRTNSNQNRFPMDFRHIFTVNFYPR